MFTGICIGGPNHGLGYIWPQSRFSVVLFRCPPKHVQDLDALQEVIHYRHLCNEFGDWWIVE